MYCVLSQSGDEDKHAHHFLIFISQHVCSGTTGCPSSTSSTSYSSRSSPSRQRQQCEVSLTPFSGLWIPPGDKYSPCEDLHRSFGADRECVSAAPLPATAGSAKTGFEVVTVSHHRIFTSSLVLNKYSFSLEILKRCFTAFQRTN